MLALLLPTSGIFALNQLVLGTGISFGSNLTDISALQWYWILSGTDVAISGGLKIGDLFAVSVGQTMVSVAGTVQIFVLSAVDVIHALAVPTLGVKADAIPGRLVNVRIASDISGIFSGQCSELCGAMHAFMPIQISHTISPAPNLFCYDFPGQLRCISQKP